MTDLPALAGRLHPLLVHLPIGLVTGALLLGLWRRRRPAPPPDAALAVLWTAAAASALLSVGSGLLHARDGGYADDLLAAHRLGGIALATFTTLAAAAHALPGTVAPALRRALAAANLGLLLYTGHAGGALTHGPGYLLPDATPAPEAAAPRPVTVVDSMDLFSDAVMPILQTHCTGCHNPAKRKGDLLLTTHADILRGGRSGTALVAGDPAASEILRRVSLPPGHPEAMPTDGRTPLTAAQRTILQGWVEQGAPASLPLARHPPDDRLRKALDEHLRRRLDTQPDSGVPAAAPRDTEALQAGGFHVRRITAAGPWLHLKAADSTRPDLARLASVRAQLRWLDLPACGLTDADIAALASLDALVRLDLSRNPVGDAGVAHLDGLRHLEYLNLYGTRITRQCLRRLSALPALRRLYVWDSRVDSLPTSPAPRAGLDIVWKTD